jgi:ubiquinone/menaquinone biosynthesis C-methylase UbiE
MAVPGSREHVRSYYEKVGSGEYDEYVGYFERWFLDDGRQWVCGQASRDVLEIAIGTGRNLPFYPSDVRLTGIDLTPAMLDKARERAADLGIDVRLVIADAQTLDFPDESFDTVVITLALSTVPSVRRVLAEAWHVLRPGGRLLLLEHVRSPRLPVRTIQRLLNPIFVRKYGDRLLRDPLDHLPDAGFTVERVERFKGGFIERVVARKPEDPFQG